MIKELKGVYSTNSLKSLVLFFILVSVSTFVLLVVVLTITANWIEDEDFQWLFLICSLILVAVNSWFSVALLNDNKLMIIRIKLQIKLVTMAFLFSFVLSIG